jgi:ABC-type branched-subunit amino acid transport system substrate-binding protein
LVFLVVFGLSLNATTARAEEPESSKIGVVLPLSGDYAALGKNVRSAVELAARRAGVSLVVEDTRGEPQGAVEAVAKLAAREDVCAIVGPLGQSESRAAAGMAQRLEVPLFSFSFAEEIDAVGPWVYRVRVSPAEQAELLAERAKKMGLNSVAILYPQTTYGERSALAFGEVFTRLGGKVTSVANYPDDTSNFSDVLDVVVGKKVYLESAPRRLGKYRRDGSGFVRVRSKPKIDFDALYIPDVHTRVARLVPFLKFAGLGFGGDEEQVDRTVQLLGTAAWQGHSMRHSGGGATGALYLDTFAGESAGGVAEAFSRSFEEATGRQPTDLEAEVYDFVHELGRAALSMRQADVPMDSRRENILRRLPWKRVWSGAAGSLQFVRGGRPMREYRWYKFDVDGHVVPWE